MLGNIAYSNPTKLYFGEGSLEHLREELPKYGRNVQLVYGGGSIKKYGIYDKVVTILKEGGKNILEDGGVMNTKELGVTEDMLDDLVQSTFVMEGGYKVLSKDEIRDILKESLE